MGNMFLHLRQVIDFRVQTRPSEGWKLWNLAAIVSIKVMNKSSWFIAKATSNLPPCYLQNWPVLTSKLSELDGPGPASGATSNDRNERKTI